MKPKHLLVEVRVQNYGTMHAEWRMVCRSCGAEAPRRFTAEEALNDKWKHMKECGNGAS